MSDIDWSKAPEGATHYNPDGTPRWYKKTSARWFVYYTATNSWDLSGNEEGWHEKTLIPRPAQWRGPQDGLPPVGMEVEFHSGKDWHKSFVIAHASHEDEPAVVLQADWGVAVRRISQVGTELRPIQSERDKAIAEMESCLDGFGCIFAERVSTREVANLLYDADFRKTC